MNPLAVLAIKEGFGLVKSWFDRKKKDSKMPSKKKATVLAALVLGAAAASPYVNIEVENNPNNIAVKIVIDNSVIEAIGESEE